MWIERDAKRAEPALERAMEIYQKINGKEHHMVTRIMHDIATVRDTYGSHEEAVQLHLEAIKIREKILGNSHPFLGISHEILGITYKLMNEHHKALQSFLKALKIHENVHGEFYTGVATCCEWLVMVYNDIGKPFLADQYEEKRRKVMDELDKLGVTTGERIVD